MSELEYDKLEIGDTLPDFTLQVITRTTLALFAGASGDHNPMHIDIDFAHEHGQEDVFAHGMLVMAYLGRALTFWVSQAAIKEFGVRFVAITHVGDQITCKACVTEKLERGKEKCVRLELLALNQEEEIKLSGEALITVS